MNPYKPDQKRESGPVRASAGRKPLQKRTKPVGGRAGTKPVRARNTELRSRTAPAPRGQKPEQISTSEIRSQKPTRLNIIKPGRIVRGEDAEILLYGKHVVKQLIKVYPKLVRYILCRPELVDEYRLIGKDAGTHCPIHTGEDPDLDKRSRGGFHQGVVAVIAKYPYASLSDIADSAQRILILDQLQDPQNVGALIRSANAFSFDAVILCEHEQVGITGTVARASVGTVFQMPIIQVTNISKAIDTLKERRFWVVGLSGDAPGAVPVGQYDFSDKTAIVVGSEGDGIRTGVEKHCDTMISIPIAESVESLNASVAGAIAMYEASKVLKISE